MSIYKIMGRAEWAAAQVAGIYEGSEHDRRDGFIHFSTAEQAAETAAKHFAARDDLLLLTITTDGFGDALKWEPSRGGALFPHLYAPLALEAVIKVRELPLGSDGVHLF